MPLSGPKPRWLTFDCYGTLIQWDEGLLAAVDRILVKHAGSTVDAATLIQVYDRYEHELESEKPHRSFKDVAGSALQMAMEELKLAYAPEDIEILTGSISRMPPFPEVVETLGALRQQGFRLCIISNTDDDIIAGNVAQMGGHIDRVITAQQAQAYKPSRQIFAYAHRALGVTKDDVVHICASPHLDLVAARDIGFRAVWIDRGTGRKPLADYVSDETFPSLDHVARLFSTSPWSS
ncbi:2-haloacid dehalogenase [Enhydrobacter aerosaccus]|uniref:2-haloacid dehalogenase n=1 Tax=Enhydrobacter aerosaccus TaxID=225324 RepID=A0A1T4PF44_9HYPH|nr:haloacid dehalogenase type II [Enhydrobacter aerosaccus]SJZ90122.1 2-haloacid dehalogenase [Enhydrobacter aerosaccus]